MSKVPKETSDAFHKAVDEMYEKARRETPPEIFYGGLLLTAEYYEWIRKTFYSE